MEPCRSDRMAQIATYLVLRIRRIIWSRELSRVVFGKPRRWAFSAVQPTQALQIRSCGDITANTGVTDGCQRGRAKRNFRAPYGHRDAKRKALVAVTWKLLSRRPWVHPHLGGIIWIT